MDISKPICPPKPNREEFEKGIEIGYYEKISLDDAEKGDIILMENHLLGSKNRYITCLEIVNPKNDKGDPKDWITIHHLREDPIQITIPFRVSKNYLTANNAKFYRINRRLNFDKVMNEQLETITNYPVDKQLTIFERVMSTPGLPDEIGKSLSKTTTKMTPKMTSKGGNRKNRKSKKNKSKKNKSKKNKSKTTNQKQQIKNKIKNNQYIT